MIYRTLNYRRVGRRKSSTCNVNITQTTFAGLRPTMIIFMIFKG